MAILFFKYFNRDEWLELRRKLGIGGSDAASVLGLNPYKSAYALWCEKTGKTPEFDGNVRTAVGSYLEDFVARKWCEETDKKVRKSNKIIANSKYPFAFADIDRSVVGEEALLEVKTTNSFPVMHKCRNGEFPEAWYCQMMHYLAVTGKQKAYLAVLINCSELRSFELERDEDEIKALMDAERRFWELVQNNEAPAPDGTDSCFEALKTAFPEDNGAEVDISPFLTDLATYDALNAQIKALNEQKDAIANKVKAYLGDAAKGRCDAYAVSWANEERKKFDAKAFERATGTDLKPYYKTSISRVFRVRAI